MLRQFARDLRATYYISPFAQVRLLHLWLMIAAFWWGLTPWTMLTRAFEQWSLVSVFVLLGICAKPILLILRLVGFVALSWIAFSGFAWAGWFAGYFHHYTTPTNQHYVLTQEIPVGFTYHRTPSGFQGRITNLSRDHLSQARVECDLFHRDGTPARRKWKVGFGARGWLETGGSVEQQIASTGLKSRYADYDLDLTRCRVTRALFFKPQRVPVFTYERDRRAHWYVFRVLNNHDQTAWRVVFNCTSDRTGRPKKITVKDRYTGAIDYKIPPGDTAQLVTPPDYIINTLSNCRAVSASWR